MPDRQRPTKAMAAVLIPALSIVAFCASLATGAGASTPKNTIPPVANMDFGNVAIGASAGPGLGGGITQGFIVASDQTVTFNLLTNVAQTGPGAGDYTLVPSTTSCPGAATGTITLSSGVLCQMNVYFTPSALGDRMATMTISYSDGTFDSLRLGGTGVTSLDFGDTTLGTFSGPNSLTLFNGSGSTDTIDLSTDVSISGPGAGDYTITPSSSCTTDGANIVSLAPSSACTLNTFFFPGALGDRSATVAIHGSVGSGWSVRLSGTGTIGYYQVDSRGNVAEFGDAGYYGDAGNTALNHPIVGMAATGDDGGYWLVASDGGIFSYGDAQFYGSTGAIHLNKPIVGMAATPDAGGYWLVASDGGIFSYGDAQFYGSTGAIHLAQPIVAMAAMPTGGGYWFSAADGGLFNYGDAPFLGSGVGTALGTVVDMVSDGGSTLQAIAGLPAIRQTHVGVLEPAVRHTPRFVGP
jgi:hypothetical protein